MLFDLASNALRQIADHLDLVGFALFVVFLWFVMRRLDVPGAQPVAKAPSEPPAPPPLRAAPPPVERIRPPAYALAVEALEAAAAGSRPPVVRVRSEPPKPAASVPFRSPLRRRRYATFGEFLRRPTDAAFDDASSGLPNGRSFAVSIQYAPGHLLHVCVSPWATPGAATAPTTAYAGDWRRLSAVAALLWRTSPDVACVDSGEFVLFVETPDESEVMRIANDLRVRIRGLAPAVDDRGGLPLATLAPLSASIGVLRKHGTVDPRIELLNWVAKKRAHAALRAGGDRIWAEPSGAPGDASTDHASFAWPQHSEADGGINRGALGYADYAYFRVSLQSPRTIISETGAGEDVAERSAYLQLQRILDCPGHDFDTTGWSRGAGVCRHCEMFRLAGHDAPA